ncbi:MAG: hypothetical protein RR346_00085 [Bacteroidales bacterium]
MKIGHQTENLSLLNKERRLYQAPILDVIEIELENTITSSAAGGMDPFPPNPQNEQQPQYRNTFGDDC